MRIKSFRDLIVWRLASELSADIAAVVKTFPRSELYALSDDLLRSARSVPANISEGFGRYHFAEKIQFYNIAKGSTLETQNHLIEARNCGYLDEKAFANFSKRYHVVEVKINNLIAATARARTQYAKRSKK